MFGRLFGGGKKRDAELHAAAQSGDMAGVRQALDKSADINALDPVHRETVLHVAVDKERKALVQFLLSRGANPNIISGQNLTPLMIAAANGDRALPLVELLLAGRADPTLAPKTEPHAGADPLIVAASKGANAILRHLLAFGVTPKILPNGSTLMHMAGIGGNAETVAIALEIGATVDDVDCEGATPLHYAVIEENALGVAALLDHGANTEKRTKQDCTPLHHAAIKNRLAPLKLLLDRGAKPDVIAVDGNTVMSPLLGAAIAGYDEVVQLLLDAGVSPEQQVGDFPPIVAMATEAGKTSTVKLLKVAILKRQTALLKAAERNNSKRERDTKDNTEPEIQLDSIREMSLLEFGDAFYRNVRFRNVLVASSAQGKPPFETVGAYLDAGEAGKMELLRLPNLGVNSVLGLDDAIRAVLQRQPMSAEPLEPPTHMKRQDLVEQFDSRYPGVFTPLLDAYAATPETDGVACTKLEAEMLRILNDQRLAEGATRRFHGETLLEIGESLGVSRERVRQIESRAKPWLAGTTDEAEPHTEETDDQTPEGIRAAWFGMYQRLKEYHARHGDADVPSKWTEYPKLGSWVGNQRQKHRKGELLPEQVTMLEELGFTWSLRERGTWEDRFGELLEFKQLHGHFDVPTDHPAAPKLKPFISSTRHQYKEGSLESERIDRLKAIGFPLDSGSRRSRKSATALVINGYELPDGYTLKGRTIAITGRLERYTRDEATRLARRHGATVLDKFSNKVELLVVGADAASKLDSARQHGIPVIDEAQFSALLAVESSAS